VNGVVLGVDPGTRKCGYAVVAEAHAPPLALGIVPTEQLVETLLELARRFSVRAVALGGGTHTAPVGAMLAQLGLPIEVVDERETTLLARRHPRGMLLPPRPIDDFAALLIAERLLESEA
jgi:RNase H-fold protein (predicted Holliday junction resolvase)